MELGQRSRRPTVAAVRLTPVLLAQLNQGTATGDRAHSLEIRVFRDSEASAKAAGQAFKAGILSVATQLPAPPPAASAVRFFALPSTSNKMWAISTVLHLSGEQRAALVEKQLGDHLVLPGCGPAQLLGRDRQPLRRWVRVTNVPDTWPPGTLLAALALLEGLEPLQASLVVDPDLGLAQAGTVDVLLGTCSMLVPEYIEFLDVTGKPVRRVGVRRLMPSPMVAAKAHAVPAAAAPAPAPAAPAAAATAAAPMAAAPMGFPRGALSAASGSAPPTAGPEAPPVSEPQAAPKEAPKAARQDPPRVPPRAPPPPAPKAPAPKAATHSTAVAPPLAAVVAAVAVPATKTQTPRQQQQEEQQQQARQQQEQQQARQQQEQQEQQQQQQGEEQLPGHPHEQLEEQPWEEPKQRRGNRKGPGPDHHQALAGSSPRPQLATSQAAGPSRGAVAVAAAAATATPQTTGTRPMGGPDLLLYSSVLRSPGRAASAVASPAALLGDKRLRSPHKAAAVDADPDTHMEDLGAENGTQQVLLLCAPPSSEGGAQADSNKRPKPPRSPQRKGPHSSGGGQARLEGLAQRAQPGAASER